MNDITTLIFDWGGVFTLGNHTKTIFNFFLERMGGTANASFSDFDDLVVQMEYGTISPEEFAGKVNSKFGSSFSVGDFRDIFEVAIRPNEGVIDMVSHLKGFYRLAMLSDNNAITLSILNDHYRYMLEPFEKCYFSNVLKLRKPDPAFFRFVMKDLNAQPEECVFIDDKQKNVDSAITCGMHAIRFVELSQLKADMRSLGIRIA